MPGSITRRGFLQGLGAAASLAPFLPLLNASGQEALAPKRLFLFYTPLGHFKPNWFPTGTPTNFSLGKSMAPLLPYASKINVLEGVSMKGNGHELGSQQLFTGQTNDSTAVFGKAVVPGATSVDQVVADAVGAQNAFKSLEFAVGAICPQWASDNRISWRDGNAQEPTQDPAAALKRVFGTYSPRDLNEGKSVLDAISADLAGIQNKLAKADQYKVAAHLSAVRDMEQSFAARSQACVAPTFSGDPAINLYAQSDLATLDPAKLVANIDALFDVAAAAFACDLTRVASLQLFGAGSYSEYQYPGTYYQHHGLSHQASSDTLGVDGATAADYAHSINGQLTTVDTFFSAQLAYFLGKLAAIPEGNGSVLDNTLVVWGNELCEVFNHDCGAGGSQFMTVGGLGGAVKTGRWLQYSSTTDPTLKNKPPTEHNRLLVSIAQAMGLTSVNTFGASDLGTGPLAGF